MSTLDTLRSDAAECHRLSQLTTRPNVRLLLTKEYERLSQLADAEAKKQPPIEKKTENKFTTKISNYGWDQSDKFVKIYISLDNVHDLPMESVISVFGVKSVDFQVFDLNNKNYSLTIKNFLNPLEPEACYHKVKTNAVTLFLKKASVQQWSHLTETEKKVSEKKMPKMDTENDDPGMGIMNFMRQMYEEGDDDMKRTIAKAWTEARDKKEPF